MESWKVAETPILYRKIVFSDEAHFWLHGYVNKQNCRFCSEDQPEALQKLPMHPEKVTILTCIHTYIIGHYNPSVGSKT